MGAQVAVSWSHTRAYTKQTSKDASRKKKFNFFFSLLNSAVVCAAAAADAEGVDGSQTLFCRHPASDLGLQPARTCASDTYFICLRGPYDL